MITVLLDAAVTPSPGDRVAAPEPETHHLRVRRTPADGREVRWTNAAGWSGAAMLVETADKPTLLIGTAERTARAAPLMLLVAAGDRERWTWLAEKAAELGVTDLVPIETERSRSVESRLRESHLAKLSVRAREACKQCGSVWAPHVHPITEIAAIEALLPVGAARLLADGEGEAMPASAVGGAAVAIGPEGGFTDGERARLAAQGFSAVRLGSNILRFETAALAAAAVLTAARARA